MGFVAIFGGTFNPVHKAHVATAEDFIEKIGLDVLYIIPNNVPPMKQTGNVSGEDRAKMLEIAFAHNEKVIVSHMELNRDGTSYTCDTVAELREMHPDSQLFLLTGDDWAEDFDKWKNYRYILENVQLVIAARGEKDITPALDKLESLTGARPSLLKNDRILLSSSQFRACPKSEYLPDGVFEYIEKRRLYGV